MEALQKTVIDTIRVHEYFMCEVPDVIKQFKLQVDKLCSKDKESVLELNKFKTNFESRQWFNKNRFDLIKDDLTTGHGSGP